MGAQKDKMEKEKESVKHGLRDVATDCGWPMALSMAGMNLAEGVRLQNHVVAAWPCRTVPDMITFYLRPNLLHMEKLV